MKLPVDVLYRVVNISNSYYILLNRLKQFECSVMNNTSHNDGQPHSNQVGKPTEQKAEKIIEKQEECERKIKAVERAWNPLGPLYQDFIKLNLFEHKDMESIDLPMTLQERKEVRAYFLIKLARNLNEI
jgi:hypothetical protein